MKFKTKKKQKKTLALLWRAAFWPPSMTYISVINTQALHFTFFHLFNKNQIPTEDNMVIHKWGKWLINVLMNVHNKFNLTSYESIHYWNLQKLLTHCTLQHNFARYTVPILWYRCSVIFRLIISLSSFKR